jgi:methionyl-tRNA synthetase
VGHALEFVQTDAIARYHRLLGEDVATLSGGDENALKNVQAAETAGIPVQQFVDENTETFRQLSIKLNAEFTFWQKGSDQVHHFPASQKLWELCKKDIYKKKYEGLYCVGCEAFYTKEELNENGECFEHPGKPLQVVAEENYFFALSKYQKQLQKIISSDEVRIFPEFRKKEMLTFIRDGLQDISVSRSNERAKNWGVPVPDDPTQKIYVWFDALNVYQSGIGFGWDEKQYNKWWPPDVQVIGKGIIRFHAIYWLAFLLSARLKLPKTLFVHGYFTVNGQKMSKTLGNVIDPVTLIAKYGADALRYYFLAKMSPFADGDFSEEKLRGVYNADLANGLGNLVSRVAKLCETNKTVLSPESYELSTAVIKNLENFEFDKALSFIWSEITQVDQKINLDKPWELNGSEVNPLLEDYTESILQIATDLQPFLPETAKKILDQFGEKSVKSGTPLFPRI